VILGNVNLPAGSDRSGIGLDAGTNNIVEYNSFSYMTQAFFDFYFEVNSEVRYNYGFHASVGASPSGTGLRFHHNILNLDAGGAGITASHAYDAVASPLPDSGPVLIYNNVIHNFTGYGFYTAGTGAFGVQLRNNIVVIKTTSFGLAQISSGVDSDYNLYFCATGAPKGWVWNNKTQYTTLSAFQAASAQERHSLYADSQFVSANPIIASDFKLKSTSPCINAGQNLKSAGLLALTQQYQDFLGTLIPPGAGIDIGAYELGGVTPPSELHVIQH
jgi:hypothetical protein